MSMRYQAAIIKPGFNPLGTQTSGYQNAIYSWGQNSSGELGQNNTINLSSPVQVGALTNWAQSSAGNAFSTCVKTDGTLWTWGDNYYGQLGDGTTVDKSSPVQVGALTSWYQVSAGGYHTTALYGVV